MAKPKIFVIHSSLDTAFASKLVNILNEAGAQAWLDTNEVGSGNFQESIDEALASCEWFLLVLTRNALKSEWVRQEVYAANRLKIQGKIKNLIFVKATNIDVSELPGLWGIFNILDATSDYTTAVDRVLEDVGLFPVWTQQRKTPHEETVESLAEAPQSMPSPSTDWMNALWNVWNVLWPYALGLFVSAVLIGIGASAVVLLVIIFDPSLVPWSH